MAAKALVDRYLDEAESLYALLQQRGHKVFAVLWYYYPDAERWLLLVSTDKLDATSDHVDKYMELVETMKTAEPPFRYVTVETVKPLRRDETPIAELGRYINTDDPLKRSEFAGNVFDGVFVDHAFIVWLNLKGH